MWERGLKLVLLVKELYPVGVAPHVGAWIETINCLNFGICSESLPMWERGLKPSEPWAAGHACGRSPCGSVD